MKVKVGFMDFMSSTARLTVLVEPLTLLITFADCRSNNRPKPSQSCTQIIVAAGRWSRRRPKMVGNMPPLPKTVGANSNLLVSQSFDVTPCCSGPAPMIIEAQLGLLEDHGRRSGT